MPAPLQSLQGQAPEGHSVPNAADVRICFLFGNFAAFIYSVSGAVLSLDGMILLKKTNAFSCVGVSVAGALLHNAGQIAAAALLMRTSEIAYYMPVLAAAGTVSGIAVGIAGGILLKRVRL